MENIFGTDGVRGSYGTWPITECGAYHLGYHFAKLLKNSNPKAHVLIGYDTRMSSLKLATALQQGLESGGALVQASGLASTPQLAYCCVHDSAVSGAVMITASHNPYTDNGFKFLTAQGTKLSLEQENILSQGFVGMELTLPQLKEPRESHDLPTQEYFSFLQDFAQLDKPCRQTVIVDCAHGSMSALAPKFLEQTSYNCQYLNTSPNGCNINESCGATNLKMLQQAVIDAPRSAIGCAFDGDGDRVLFVDETGGIVDGDKIICLIARLLQRQGLLKAGGVVGTQMSNIGMEQYLAGLGLSFARAQVGDKYVAQILADKGWPLGGEQSGHILLPGYNPCGDGLLATLLVLQLLSETQLPLSQLQQDIPVFPQVSYSIKSHNLDELLVHPEIVDKLAQTRATLAGAGRVLLRKSGTEPLLRLMLEGEDPLLLEKLGTSLVQTIEAAAHNLAKHQEAS